MKRNKKRIKEGRKRGHVGHDVVALLEKFLVVALHSERDVRTEDDVSPVAPCVGVVKALVVVVCGWQ